MKIILDNNNFLMDTDEIGLLPAQRRALPDSLDMILWKIGEWVV
jgi:hypothetical protein